MKFHLWLAIGMFSYIHIALDQDTTALKIPDKFLDQVHRKTACLESKADKCLEKSLDLYLKQERLMKAKLALVDPGKADDVFNGAIGKFEQYKANIKSKATAVIQQSNAIGNNYVDSLAGSLAFIKDAKGAICANGAKAIDGFY
jgi:hypothetical protein